MEKQKENSVILDVKECQEICDWLLKRGLSLRECAAFLCDMQSGDTFALALTKVFLNRKQTQEDIHAKNHVVDWGNPITP